MRVQTVYVGMVPNDARHPVSVNVSQYDANFVLRVGLVADDADFVIESGTSAKVRGKKADGTSYTANASLSGKYAVINGDRNMTNVAGTGVFEICLTHGGKELYSSNFYLVVEPRPINE